MLLLHDAGVMDDEPVAPVFLLDGGDVMVVEDPAFASRELEPFLADQPVELYDALGRPVSIVVTGQSARERVAGLVVADGPLQELRLREALTAYLRAARRTPPKEPDILDFARAAARLIR